MHSGILPWLIAFTVLPGVALAQEPDGAPTTDSIADLVARVAVLERRVDSLEALLSSTNAVKAIADVVEAAIQPRNSQRSGDPTNSDAWRAIRKGMNKADIRKLLGDPDTVNRYGLAEEWKWDAEPWGSVNFDESGLVDVWISPYP